MKKKYPAKFFWFFVLTSFLFHFFYLSIPGFLLCVVGLWVRPCLWIGLAILLLDLVLSIIDQLQLRKVALTPSDNPEFNEITDAFCGPEGLDGVRKILNKKIKSDASSDSNENA